MTPQEIAQELLTVFGPEGSGWTQTLFFARRVEGAFGPETEACLNSEADCRCLVGGMIEIDHPGASCMQYARISRAQDQAFRSAFRQAYTQVSGCHHDDLGIMTLNDLPAMTWPTMKAILERIADA